MRLIFCTALLAAAPFAHAQRADAPVSATPVLPASGYTQLDTVNIEGAQPGPGLWQVNKNGRTVWILGTVSPLPAGMQWQSATVKEVIAQSQEIIYPPAITIDADMGFFKGLLLLPSLRKMDRNPDDKQLKDVLSAPGYARWQKLKARYLPNDKDIERKRPMFAAGELLRAAYAKSGLSSKSLIWPPVRETVKAHDIKGTKTALTLRIDDPSKALKEFKSESMNDEACLSKSMALLENSIPAIKARANAWARGDVARIRQLAVVDTESDCVQALMEAQVAAKRGLRDGPAKMRRNWLAAVESAINKNENTFAVLPIDTLLGKDGYLAHLRQAGYEIVEP